MGSLFDRLEAAGGVNVGGAHPAIANSILDNIRRILNARQGCCQTRGDFGLPELTSLSQEAAETIPAIASAVKAQLERFEPRLRHVLVQPSTVASATGGYAFAITGVLTAGQKRGALRFAAVIDRNGQVRLMD